MATWWLSIAIFCTCKALHRRNCRQGVLVTNVTLEGLTNCLLYSVDWLLVLTYNFRQGNSVRDSGVGTSRFTFNAHDAVILWAKRDASKPEIRLLLSCAIISKKRDCARLILTKSFDPHIFLMVYFLCLVDFLSSGLVCFCTSSIGSIPFTVLVVVVVK